MYVTTEDGIFFLLCEREREREVVKEGEMMEMKYMGSEGRAGKCEHKSKSEKD